MFTKCERCGGRIGMVRDVPTCMMCGHDLTPKQYPESTDADIRWMQLHDAKAARQYGPAPKVE